MNPPVWFPSGPPKVSSTGLSGAPFFWTLTKNRLCRAGKERRASPALEAQSDGIRIEATPASRAAARREGGDPLAGGIGPDPLLYQVDRLPVHLVPLPLA